MQLEDFNYQLPQERIALQPVCPRDSSKLLHLKKNSDSQDLIFSDLPKLLKTGDVVVFNNTKVIPARLNGKCGQSDVEVTLNKIISPGKWSVFAKPGRKLKVGSKYIIAKDFEAIVVDKQDFQTILEFDYEDALFYQLLSKYGLPPLPPYIKRQKEDELTSTDKENYQTIYAKKEGAVAAPTAGLHFTEELIEEIKSKGIKIAYVTLHVGAGTFLPVKVDNIEEHKMHSEYIEVSQENVGIINKARNEGGRVVSVGTTSLRVLESVADKDGLLREFFGDTEIFIKPGYKFKIVDVLITNFHLPKSTLLMLVSAFYGLDNIKLAYSHAIDNEYRFFSYGDACIIEKIVY